MAHREKEGETAPVWGRAKPPPDGPAGEKKEGAMDEAAKIAQVGLIMIEEAVREAIPAAERVIVGASRNASGQSASRDWVVAVWIPGPGGRVHVQAQGPDLRAVVDEVVRRATSTAAACPSCGRPYHGAPEGEDDIERARRLT